MTPHAAFAVVEASQVGAARRFAAGLAGELGFDEVAAGRLAIVVNELGHNLVRHARDGSLLVGGCGDEADAGVELISLDRGPGIADVARCLQDGFSTGGTPGTGLGAVRRLSRQFELFSQPGQGTAILARIAARTSAPPVAGSHALDVAGLCVAAPGETVCGDSWAVTLRGQSGRLLVADGLGHGPEAAAAADAAVEVFRDHPALPETALLERMHERLRSTRGAAVALVAFDAAAGTLSICGAGNIAGRLISGTGDRSLMTQHGTVGLQIRRPQPMHCEWGEHAVVVLHSDGVATRWSLAEVPGLVRAPAALIAAWILHQHLRGRDDATVVVLRRA